MKIEKYEQAVILQNEIHNIEGILEQFEGIDVIRFFRKGGFVYETDTVGIVKIHKDKVLIKLKTKVAFLKKEFKELWRLNTKSKTLNNL